MFRHLAWSHLIDDGRDHADLDDEQDDVTDGIARSIADWIVRPRLLGVSGVSQVMIIGGETKQYQVLVDPGKLADYRLTLEEVTEAVGASNANASGGFLERPNEEFLIRARARVYSPEDLANSVVTVREGADISE